MSDVDAPVSCTGASRAGKRMKTDTRTPIDAIRKHCLGCCNGSFKAVRFCTCDGVTSTWCELWPYRFGLRPATAKKRFGGRFLTPGALPHAGVELEDCA